jgi:hypothetical protein
MAQHDMVLDDAAGIAFRADLNNALAAIVSNNSGATEPATLYAYMWWADTASGWLKQRNAANNAWVNKITLAAAMTTVGAALYSAADAAAARTAIGALAAADDISLAAGKIISFEGTTDDAHETTLSGGDPTADRTITLPDMSGQIAVQARGTDIASAGTINLTTATGDIVDVTGTTSITAITLADGLERKVRFTGALTLTNGASLVLPSGANIATGAGDFAVFRGYAAGVVRCVSYTKASGQSVVGASGLTLGTAVATTSGTSIDFTGIPSSAKRVRVMFQGVSTNGTSQWLVQIGNGSIVTTGYVGHASSGAGQTANGAGFNVNNNVVAANNHSGEIVIGLIDTNVYTQFGIIASQTISNSLVSSAGSVSLGGVMDRVRITTVGGTDTFDAGKINISYE